MSTYTQTLDHLALASKDRRPVLSDGQKTDLFRYVNDIIKHNHCKPVWISGDSQP